MDILQTIANAKPGSMIDVRSPDNQVDSFPVSELLSLLTGANDEAEPLLTSRDLQEMFNDGCGQ